MDVVVVESPAKARTINKYLGPGFTVIASYGHVRDLPAKDGSVQPDDDFTMVWQVESKGQKHLKTIAEAVRGARKLFLATDPDREGEAISWHVQQALAERNALAGIDIKRVVFNEITRGAILEAFAKPRDLDHALIDAYLARRALDYLVGFTLSPVLWRKLPGSRSAGRVQSVALRLVCDREEEIERFRAQEYWTVKVVFATTSGEPFTATLTHLDGIKLDKFALPDQAAAERAVAEIVARQYRIDRVERKQTRRNPAPPFITSTLQQEASRKLGFSASHTMRVAQKLYEGVAIGSESVGLITYMRTDGVQMAADAVAGCRDLIARDFGDRYLPDKPRIYKTKVKNAQEAHEAIRPTDIRRRPEIVQPYLDRDQFRLYKLIWQRTLACQMASAVLDQVAVDVIADDGRVILRATGSVIAFDGFLKVYREGRDDDAERDGDEPAMLDGETVLPAVRTGEPVARRDVLPAQHFTQPPPRFTEASLVKRLEELGIGRPSTYASILSVLQDRDYVRLEKGRFFPEDRGRLVTAFLTSFFERYVAYGFTAEMEEKLDDISGGRIDWKQVLREFWDDFVAAVDGTKELRVKEVLDALDRHLAPHFFPPSDNGSDPRTCPSCSAGRLGIRLGKFGAFIGCSNYPECRYTRPLLPVRSDESAANGSADPNGRILGTDPGSGQPVSVRKGPYGFYVQRGDAGNGEAKPKRVALPKTANPEQLTLDAAHALLALPRLVGAHPDSGEPIEANIGRFGPYLKMGDLFVSLKGDDDVVTVGLNRAVDLIDHAARSGRAGRALGNHPVDGKPVRLRKGRFGDFVEHAGTRVSLPKGADTEAVTLAEALALLSTKSAASAKPKTKKGVAVQRPRGKKARETGKAAETEAIEAKERTVRTAPQSKTKTKSGAKASRSAPPRPPATKAKARPDSRAPDRARDRGA